MKTEKQYDPYGIDKLTRVPVIIKVLLLKFWGAGAAGYLVFLSFSMTNPTAIYEAYWLVHTLVTDIIINRFIMMWAKPDAPTRQFTFITGRSLFSLIFNLIYMFIVVLIISLPLQLFIVDKLLTDNLMMPLIYAFSFIFVDGIALILKYKISKIIRKYLDNKKQTAL